MWHRNQNSLTESTENAGKKVEYADLDSPLLKK